MSLFEQNRMLHILYKNEVCRKNVSIIMNDLNKAGIFDDHFEDYNDDDDDWLLLEQASDLRFSKYVSVEKIKNIKDLKKKKEEVDNNQMTQYFIDQERRIKEKIQNVIDSGEIVFEEDYFEVEIKDLNIRYGRSPLHEAISMRSIKLVKRYIKNGKYLEYLDNNGHTAWEMAYYENYEEALALFEHYAEERKKEQV